MCESGIIFVKLPLNNRSTRLSKAWSKKLVIIEQKAVASADNVSECVCIRILPANNDPQVQQSMKDQSLQFWFTPRKCVLFRCKSRSQSYSFTLCENSEAVIHFATKSETESQRWMKHIRNLLWPPSSFIELETTLGSAFEVSIIDNEYTHRAGLLGMYGHLNISSKKVCLTHPQTGHVIQEWYLSTVSFKQLHQNNKNDENKIITMIVDTKSSTGCGNIIFYCENAAEIINRVHSVRQMFENGNRYGAELVKQISICETDECQVSKTVDNECESSHIYATPRNDGKKFEVFDNPSFKFNRPMSDSFILNSETIPKDMNAARPSSLRHSRHNRFFGERNIFNIPASMLDCSISSTLSRRVNNSSSDEESGVNFPLTDESLEEEAIYQEIDEVKQNLSTEETQENQTNENGISSESEKEYGNNECVESQLNLSDQKLTELFDDLQSLKLDHKQFIVRIKKMLTECKETTDNCFQRDTASDEDDKLQSSCEYCDMKAIAEKLEIPESEYVDMTKYGSQ